MRTSTFARNAGSAVKAALQTLMFFTNEASMRTDVSRAITEYELLREEFIAMYASNLYDEAAVGRICRKMESRLLACSLPTEIAWRNERADQQILTSGEKKTVEQCVAAVDRAGIPVMLHDEVIQRTASIALLYFRDEAIMRKAVGKAIKKLTKYKSLSTPDAVSHSKPLAERLQYYQLVCSLPARIETLAEGALLASQEEALRACHRAIEKASVPTFLGEDVDQRLAELRRTWTAFQREWTASLAGNA